ncbi:hypothetical protein A2Z22_04330 [Candidatus Woesebacteria bacterium RBG_16_34_12]|uniref:Uncharacterized protein n=1 Tax=Candidatus Woesebacteria bacterium RBG_16_34_12 TaxID=1802480 RepID=A0A1F7X9R8_9BACT|nr:MAG: hypothetical protein A2Z22_04330 [Candidatus Woesebacteria bacterium RBG_16_34_12]
MTSKEAETLSLEDAAFRVEQELFDGSDLGAKLVATVHKTSMGSVGNVWYIPSEGEAYRLLPERQMSDEPNALKLVGEVYRLALTTKEKETKDGDFSISMRLGVVGLYSAAKQVAQGLGETI